MTPLYAIRHISSGRWLLLRWASPGNHEIGLGADPEQAWVVRTQEEAEQTRTTAKVPEEWKVVEHPTFDYDVIKAWSNCHISGSDAMSRLGISWRGILHNLIAMLDLPYPRLPEPMLSQQVDGTLRFFAQAEGCSPDRRATICRDGDVYVAYIEQDDVLDATESDPNPVALAQKLIDQEVYIGLVGGDKATKDAVKAAMRQLLDTQNKPDKKPDSAL